MEFRPDQQLAYLGSILETRTRPRLSYLVPLAERSCKSQIRLGGVLYCSRNSATQRSPRRRRGNTQTIRAVSEQYACYPTEREHIRLLLRISGITTVINSRRAEAASQLVRTKRDGDLELWTAANAGQSFSFSGHSAKRSAQRRLLSAPDSCLATAR